MLSIVNIVARNWEQVTHGTAGVSGIPDDDDDLGSARLGHAGDGGGVGVSALAQSGSGCGPRARTSRAARSIGVAVARERTIAFVVSAFFVGVAGALFGMFIGSFNPDAFFLNITFLMIVMLVIGGTTSLAGAVVGTIAISAVSEILRRVEGGVDLGFVQVSGKPGLREVALALVMLAILIFRPGGSDRRTRDRLAVASAICQGVRPMSRSLLSIAAALPCSRAHRCGRVGLGHGCERARS